MPELPARRLHDHPYRRAGGSTTLRIGPPRKFAELYALSNFSFLRGASHPEELVERAASLGYRAIAITDECSVAGCVRAHVAARETSIQLLPGSSFQLEGGGAVILHPVDRRGWGRLCRLITTARRRASKGRYRFRISDLIDHESSNLALVAPAEWALAPHAGEEALRRAAIDLQRIREIFGDRAYLAACLSDGPDDRARLRRLEWLESRTELPLVAAGAVEAHTAARRQLRDVLTAIREKTTVRALGFRIPSRLRTLRTLPELGRLHRHRQDLTERTNEVADRCRFDLDQLRYEYPLDGTLSDLRAAVRSGERERWPLGTPERVRRLLAHELQLIEELGYASYFLTVHDIVKFARSRGILCQGRGSAANSAVCYCLGITSVDPDRFDVLFERFVSRDRAEPPDIDVDFEHERREEVIQYIYRRYGRDRAALAATLITWRARSALRDAGRALGLARDQIDRLAKSVEHWGDLPDPERFLPDAGLDPDDPNLSCVVRVARELLGFPRHLSQHVGGMVMTRGPLCELVPIENAAMPDRTVIQWDKDDLDALGILKVDCLALGMLTAIRKSFDLIARVKGRRLTLATVPPEVPEVYEMASRADTIGTFQIESRAQMAMLPRFKPRCFYDLVIEVAIVRPGPIQGGMVHPYLRRRSGDEPVSYPSPQVRRVLEKTLGVPIFQEQVMQLAVVAAGFTPGEADQLRRAMAAWRRPGSLERFEKKLIAGMLQRGYDRSFAEAVFRQIQGFGEYGFPESHAASFALLTYVSCWLKRFEPAAFTAALLNSQPMGFYAPAQLVRDAREHGVEVRPPDVTASEYDCTLESVEDGEVALRLGMRLIKGLSRASAERIVAARSKRAFRSILDCMRRARLERRDARLLAQAGAFSGVSEHRREALWEAGAGLEESPLFDTEQLREPPVELRPPGLFAIVHDDYARCGLSLAAHPVALIRPKLRRMGIEPTMRLRDLQHGRRVRVAGLVICRQRPATASGILFVTLEDETGFANLVVRLQTQRKFRRPLHRSGLLAAKGTVERAGDVVHLLVDHVEDVGHLHLDLALSSRDFR